MEETMSEVLGAEEQEVADPVETQETGAEEREPAEPADTNGTDTAEKDSGKTEQDEAFAEMRRAKEAAEAEKAEAEKRAKEVEEELTRQNALLSRVSDAENPTLDIAAQMLGIDPAELEEALNEEMEQERIEQERDTLQEELDRLRIEKAMEKDLLEVKKIDPKVESLEDLGSAFFNCIGAGMSATEAVSYTHLNLQGAYLQDAYLRDTNLQDTNLQGANLQGAYLQGAYLRDANLRDANLQGANLQGANLNYPINCPETGSFIGYKKAVDGRIVKLLITDDAKRCSGTRRKCRCSKAQVLEITDISGNNHDNAISIHDKNFIYKVGKTVEVDNFDENRWNECSTGIHFFITRQEAVEYL